MTPEELYSLGVEYRKNKRFGEAINAFRAAAQAPDASEEIKRKSLASVELMQEINGFVNVDLMNPWARVLIFVNSFLNVTLSPTYPRETPVPA